MSKKFVRFKSDGGPAWGKILDDTDPLEVKAVQLDGGRANLDASNPDYERLTDQLREAVELNPVTIQPGSFLPPVVNPPNIWAAGVNYYEHGAATGQLTDTKKAKRPLWFPKWTNAVTAHASPIYLPQDAPLCVDYEVELAVIIGRQGKDIPVEKAAEFIAALTIANDVSARDVQEVYPVFAPNAQWGKGKSYDTFCPLGYWVIDADVRNLDIRLFVNNELKQIANTKEMIFSVFELISYASRDTTLLPGTVILTGTPKGTQIEKHFAKEEPRFLQDGDKVTAVIQDLGALVNFVKKTE